MPLSDSCSRNSSDDEEKSGRDEEMNGFQRNNSNKLVGDLSSSSPSATSTNNNSNNNNQSCASSNDSSNNNNHFVQRESMHVFYLRLLVLLVLLLAAAAVSCVIFFITRHADHDRLKSDYDAAADKVLDTFLAIADQKMGAAASFVVSMVAEGQSSNITTWPFVTMTAFQERAATIKKLSGAIYIGMNPKVNHEDRDAWEAYSFGPAGQEWYQQARRYQQLLGLDDLDNRLPMETDDPRLNLTTGIADHIYNYERAVGSKAVISPIAPFYLPVWQTSPVTKRTMINQNRAYNSQAARDCMKYGEIHFEQMQYSTPGYGDDVNPVTAEIAWLLRLANRKRTEYLGDIFTTVYFPVYDALQVEPSQRKAVGVMRIVIHWARYFENSLPDNMHGMLVVLENGCDEPYSYQISGDEVKPLGHGDWHDAQYDAWVRTATFAGVTSVEDGTPYGIPISNKTCPYSIRVYPAHHFVKDYQTKTPMLSTFSVACVFVFAVMVFFLYDYLVEHRQSALLRKAKQTHDIVSSLFPKQIRDQLLQETNQDSKKSSGSGTLLGGQSRLKNFLSNGKDDDAGKAPIADLYPHTTVMFADISGFTAWSSSREPAEVFVLLQNVYQAFDHIAKRRKVFKVETIGDSYVAVTGLPDPQPNHAIIMARFASDCLFQMVEVTRQLETTLGPDTGDLAMRVGLHSGPVTAGVLRGERSRFQLFGDTVNTAARMESTGSAGRIQCSQSTAELLIQAGKEHWVTKREDHVVAKGKGVLITFWLSPQAKRASSMAGSEAPNDSDVGTPSPLISNNVPSASSPSKLLRKMEEDAKAKQCEKHERLIDWMLELFSGMIRPIVARQVAMKLKTTPLLIPEKQLGEIALDELVETIQLPEFDASAVGANVDLVEVPSNIVRALRQYISIIASAYKDNPFHNFEHACHVTMSVNKFLKRIVTPDMELKDIETATDDHEKIASQIASHIHDYTHGINSDPLTLFAIVFSALIHDVDHRGVSNVQLMNEEPIMAAMFRSKSIAEQNSLELSWDLLMSDDFKTLREYIFANQDELKRFRQVIVNVVLATDIFDKELNDLRKARWGKAFSDSTSSQENQALRATIVIEHIIQASDVSHTMQHWHVYRKWNKRLFFEMLRAYHAGRMASDPAAFWYKGELGFFDNYVIPLSKKLKDCYVFGVSSDECLNYAVRNRAEWELRGEEVIAEMLKEYRENC